MSDDTQAPALVVDRWTVAVNPCGCRVAATDHAIEEFVAHQTAAGRIITTAPDPLTLDHCRCQALVVDVDLVEELAEACNKDGWDAQAWTNYLSCSGPAVMLALLAERREMMEAMRLSHDLLNTPTARRRWGAAPVYQRTIKALRAFGFLPIRGGAR